jgi:hypothetical protein
VAVAVARAVSVYQEQVIHHMAELGLRQASLEVPSVVQVEEVEAHLDRILATAHRAEEMDRHLESAQQAQQIPEGVEDRGVPTHTQVGRVGRVL